MTPFDATAYRRADSRARSHDPCGRCRRHRSGAIGDVARRRAIDCATNRGMTQSQWTAGDDYLTKRLFPPDAALDHALESAQAGGLPPINVTAAQGQLLHILAKAQQARTILEVG